MKQNDINKIIEQIDNEVTTTFANYCHLMESGNFDREFEVASVQFQYALMRISQTYIHLMSKKGREAHAGLMKKLRDHLEKHDLMEFNEDGSIKGINVHYREKCDGECEMNKKEIIN